MIYYTGTGIPFQVSPEDEKFVTERKWHHTAFGYIGTNIKIDGAWRAVKLHRWILGVTDPNVFVDHINGDPTDNRRENLRLVTRKQNAANGRPRAGCVSEYKGVSYLRDRPRAWRAALRAKVIGHFHTEEEAALAYDTAAREAYGEHAYLNFPDTTKRVEGTILFKGTCAHCGEPFEGKLARGAYCSKSCTTLAWQKRRRHKERLGIFG